MNFSHIRKENYDMKKVLLGVLQAASFTILLIFFSFLSAIIETIVIEFISSFKFLDWLTGGAIYRGTFKDSIIPACIMFATAYILKFLFKKTNITNVGAALIAMIFSYFVIEGIIISLGSFWNVAETIWYYMVMGFVLYTELEDILEFKIIEKKENES